MHCIGVLFVVVHHNLWHVVNWITLYFLVAIGLVAPSTSSFTSSLTADVPHQASPLPTDNIHGSSKRCFLSVMLAIFVLVLSADAYNSFTSLDTL